MVSSPLGSHPHRSIPPSVSSESVKHKDDKSAEKVIMIKEKTIGRVVRTEKISPHSSHSIHATRMTDSPVKGAWNARVSMTTDLFSASINSPISPFSSTSHSPAPSPPSTPVSPRVPPTKSVMHSLNALVEVEEKEKEGKEERETKDIAHHRTKTPVHPNVPSLSRNPTARVLRVLSPEKIEENRKLDAIELGKLEVLLRLSPSEFERRTKEMASDVEELMAGRKVVGLEDKIKYLGDANARFRLIDHLKNDMNKMIDWAVKRGRPKGKTHGDGKTRKVELLLEHEIEMINQFCKKIQLLERMNCYAADLTLANDANTTLTKDTSTSSKYEVTPLKKGPSTSALFNLKILKRDLGELTHSMFLREKSRIESEIILKLEEKEKNNKK